MTFDEVRTAFPVLERFAYLNAGSLGPMSRATIDAMEERNRFDHEQGRSGKAWIDSMLALRVRVREKLAAAIGASPDRLALTSSTTDGCNIVLAGFGLRAADEVVTTDAEHPGLLLPLHVSGARVRVAEVTTRPSSEAASAILDQVTPRTRLIALSHVLWTTGQVMPVHELRRATGLPMLVDGAPAWRFDRARELARRCREALAAAGHELVADGDATLVPFVAPGDPAADAARLYDAGVIVRDLPGTGWLRVSCGWWNNEEDIARLAGALRT